MHHVQLLCVLAGNYKIPTADNIPRDFRVKLLQNLPNERAVHSSKAVGEPPLHLGATVLFALKDACYAARKDAGAHRLHDCIDGDGMVRVLQCMRRHQYPGSRTDAL